MSNSFNTSLSTTLPKLFFGLCLVTGNYLYSQNLVPNPGFEEVNYDHCGLFPSPKSFNSSIKYWTTPTDSRPELLTKKVDSSCWNHLLEARTIPSNNNIVASILMLDNRVDRKADFRSYLQVQMKEKLKIGKSYSVEVYFRWSESNLICNNFGIYFSDTAIYRNGHDYLKFTPQVNFTMTEQTHEWIKLSSSFKALSENRYLLIGNFYSNSETQIKKLTPNSLSIQESVFCYIDNVKVILQDSP